MLVSLFRKCCRILWSHLSYQQHLIWLFLLVLLSQQLKGSSGKPTKWNHSIQRRFMWKQMDSTVDGFVDRVVTGARVMKGMIGDFMPPKQSNANVMDYLPTETTRIKYIIRNPHTKETKVIRVRPSKKVIKLMAMTPKPLLPDKPKHMNEPEPILDKLKSMPMKEPEYTTENLKSFYMMAPNKLRQLEKEQELIAEGRIPIRSESRPTYMAYKSEKPKYEGNYFNADDSIVSGKIQDINESWKPVYKLGDPPAGFSTSKPYMMSALHTSVVGELLPEPQKQVYEPLTSNHFPEEEPKKSHTYEVTEYTAEETVAQPYSHEYFMHQSPSDLHSFKHYTVNTENPKTDNDHDSNTYHTEYRSQRGESSLKNFKVTTEIPKIVAQIDNDHDSRAYYTEYRSQQGESNIKHFTVTTEIPKIVDQIDNDHSSNNYHTEYRSQRGESNIKHFTVATKIPKIRDQIDNDHDSNTYHAEYRSQRGFLPTRGSYRLTEETTTTSSPITTTEEPNYPAVFLKKIRSRPDSSYNFKVQQHTKSPEISLENSWIPSNSSYASQRVRQIPHHLTSISSLPRVKSQKWPPESENIYLNSEPLPSYDTSSTTELPVVQELTTQIILNNNNSRKNVRLKSPYFSSFTEAKHRSVRHRGSVKYGDKLEIEER